MLDYVRVINFLLLLLHFLYVLPGVRLSCCLPVLIQLRVKTTARIFVKMFTKDAGSTTAALVAILHTVNNMLSSNPYVRVFALDFSKAFDTVRHNTLMEKLSELSIPDHIYNWIHNWLNITVHTLQSLPRKCQRLLQLQPVLSRDRDSVQQHTSLLLQTYDLFVQATG